MGYKWTCVFAAVLQIIGAVRPTCPSDPNCVCGGTLAVELNCNVDGRTVTINLLPDIYINIKCENASSLDYSKLPRCASPQSSFKSVSFKDCPLPVTSFKDVLTSMGVSKTMALIFQNTKNLSGYFDRKHFAGLQDLTKLLLSINGNTQLPDNLFMDINNLTWLNIRSNSIYLSENLLKPLERLETLEISHNHMTNISSNMFSHLSFLRKLSLWQSNVTWFSKDFFTGVNVLEELDLSSNGLNELPASIFKPLRKLKKLTLFSNKFSSLPRNLFKSNRELETVIILNNDVTLKELPRYLFGSLTNLKQVYIQRCGLMTVPYDLFVDSPNITNISLAYNNINALPEALFNDQINLLELDLSHNNLKDLEPKLFSSLVRLESLNLDYNNLEEISGSTFSSLLSLIYLSVEHNNLKIVSSYLFCNNKQRMYISLAYNNLNFEYNVLDNNTWPAEPVLLSPFSNTYNLRVLNLSHNEFKNTFVDWFANGHDTLDIRYNQISLLMGKRVNPKEKRRLNQDHSYHHVLIANNPINCDCHTWNFMKDMQSRHFKWDDMAALRCSRWSKMCQRDEKVFLYVVCAAVTFVLIVATIGFYLYRRRLYYITKTTIRKALDSSVPKPRQLNLTIKCAEEDNEFVTTNILPVLNTYQNVTTEVVYPGHCKETNTEKDITSDAKEKRITLVVFSPNYLTSAYRDVNIKKIRGEILKTRNTVYVFVDIGPDNSIYAFLKEQRDYRTTILWSDSKFWHNLLVLVKYNKRSKHAARERTVGSEKADITRLSCPHLFAIDTVAHSQV
ncbi:protein toll-like [Cydia pomonella]|uniref:protein toll-like n=1 Tax=Cydia pomonella TaxID=82600 RepID=UPI002ADE1637|nr:protein toll-like [Cydia pomonella]XP_061704894.1 protein toll-like [Cydia pomonella]